MYFRRIRHRNRIMIIYQELESGPHKNDAYPQNSHNLDYFCCGLIIFLQNLNVCFLTMREFFVDILKIFVSFLFCGVNTQKIWNSHWLVSIVHTRNYEHSND
jgi:hypothetical protein